MTRRGTPTFRCRLCDQPEGKSRDIPQWMFDSSVCTQMREMEQAQVSLFALRSLVSLIAEVDAPLGRHDSVVEDMLFQTENGDSCHEPTTFHEAKKISKPVVRDSIERASLDYTSNAGKNRSPE